jgi:hypothetical protein
VKSHRQFTIAGYSTTREQAMADFKARWSTAFGEKQTSIFLVDVQLSRKEISHFTIGKAPPNVITAIRVAELFCIGEVVMSRRGQSCLIL